MNYENMKYVEIENMKNYKLYENGDIINTKFNKKKSTYFDGNQYLLNIQIKNKIHYFNYLRLMYEKFYDDKLTPNFIIKLKDDTIDNKFHYTNLIKINRKDILKNENHEELDNTKEWKIVKNYPDYKISNVGDIFSIKSNQMLKPKLDNNGYYKIKLINNENRREMFIHRLVYDTYKNIKYNNTVIDHIDRVKTNNNINNLREVSHSDNMKNCNKKIYKKNKIHQYSINNEFIKEWNCFDDIKNELGYNSGNIANCYIGKTKSAYNFIWKNPLIIDDIEEFKEINTGDENIFSVYKINKKGIVINKNNIIIKQFFNGGYYKVILYNDDKKPKNLFIHKLIAQTFLNNPNNYKIVNHIDENKLNNNIENLEWMNHTQNITYSQGKKINKIDLETNKILKTYNSINDAVRDLGKNSNGNISKVLNKERKSAYGFKWEFCNG